jgi:hypothetical protein
MSSPAKHILPFLLAVALGLGLTGGFVHVGMMGHDGPSCVTYCLSVGHVPDSAPLVVFTTLLLSIMVLAAVTLYRLFAAQAPRLGSQAHARPSPNLIALYSHRLD